MANKLFQKSLPNRVSITTERTWWQSHKLRVKGSVIGILALLGCLLVLLIYFYDEPLVSPLSGVTSFQFLKGERQETPFFQNEKKVVYGFLPYWNLAKANIQPEITHLAYFSLGIGADGTIVSTNEQNQLEPGYSRLGSDRLLELANQVTRNKGKIDIVLTQFNNAEIEAFLASPSAHQQTMSSLDSLLLAYPITGVNIDIEYVGSATPVLRYQYVQFIKTLRNHLNQKYKNITLSIDLYASAADRPLIWDVPALASSVDYFIVMAYDFHRRSSPTAGPVAPLFGAQEYWDSDINQYMKAFLVHVPKEKLVLGLPFYGYGWQTTSEAAQSTTYPDTGSTYSYERIEQLFTQRAELNLKEYWHDTSLSPYLTYTEDDKTYVVHYENARSIAYKLEYARQLDLAGIAIWALGYEGTTRDLWQPIMQTH